MCVELAVINFFRKSEGWFIDIVDIDERLLGKPAATNIVVNLPELPPPNILAQHQKPLTTKVSIVD
ncbi:hypothetical protein QUA40_18235 [Microcoleus sp. Pol11C3]|uniref:hypothetical protein n=1 Tax=Microcoleus sp. Pol11C3 TaxID=3055390 RepID=UPI002FCF2425